MGTSCYPLSPIDDKIGQVEEGDQLRVILNNLGYCDERDRSFLDSEKTQKYFKLMNDEAPAKERAELSSFLQLKSPAISELLKPML